jgi:tetratricopeptide (TPR) repeat protein
MARIASWAVLAAGFLAVRSHAIEADGWNACLRAAAEPYLGVHSPLENPDEQLANWLKGAEDFMARGIALPPASRDSGTVATARCRRDRVERTLGLSHADTLAELDRLATAYENEGMTEQAIRAEAELALVHEKGGDPRRRLAAYAEVARLQLNAGRYEEAEPHFQRWLEWQRRNPRTDNDESLTLEALGLIRFRQQRYGDAERFLKEAVALAEKRHGATDWNTHRMLRDLADVYRVQSRYAEGEAVMKKAVASMTTDTAHGEVYQDDDLRLLATIHEQMKRWREAADEYARFVKLRTRPIPALYASPRLPEEEVAQALEGLARCRRALGLAGKAAEAEKEAKSIRADIEVASQASQAQAERRRVEADIAIVVLLHTRLEAAERESGAGDPETVPHLRALGLHFLQLGRAAESRTMLAAAAAIDEEMHNANVDRRQACLAAGAWNLKEGNLDRAQAQIGYGLAGSDPERLPRLPRLAAKGAGVEVPPEIEVDMLCSIAMIQATEGPQSPALFPPLDTLGNFYRHAGRWEPADEAYRRALELRRGQSTPGELRGALDARVNTLLELRRFSEAELLARESLGISEAGNDAFWAAHAQLSLGKSLRGSGRHAEAEAVLGQAVARFEKDNQLASASFAMLEIARSYADQARYAEAEAVLARAVAIQAKEIDEPGSDRPALAQALQELALLHERLGHHAQAETALKQLITLEKKPIADGFAVAAAMELYQQFLRRRDRRREADILFSDMIKVRNAAEMEQRVSLQRDRDFERDRGRIAEVRLRTRVVLAEKSGAPPAEQASVMRALAVLYLAQRRGEEAKLLFANAATLVPAK